MISLNVSLTCSRSAISGESRMRRTSTSRGSAWHMVCHVTLSVFCTMTVMVAMAFDTALTSPSDNSAAAPMRITANRAVITVVRSTASLTSFAEWPLNWRFSDGLPGEPPEPALASSSTSSSAAMSELHTQNLITRTTGPSDAERTNESRPPMSPSLMSEKRALSPPCCTNLRRHSTLASSSSCASAEAGIRCDSTVWHAYTRRQKLFPGPSKSAHKLGSAAAALSFCSDDLDVGTICRIFQAASQVDGISRNLKRVAMYASLVERVSLGDGRSSSAISPAKMSSCTETYSPCLSPSSERVWFAPLSESRKSGWPALAICTGLRICFFPIADCAASAATAPASATALSSSASMTVGADTSRLAPQSSARRTAWTSASFSIMWLCTESLWTLATSFPIIRLSSMSSPWARQPWAGSELNSASRRRYCDSTASQWLTFPSSCAAGDCRRVKTLSRRSYRPSPTVGSANVDSGSFVSVVHVSRFMPVRRAR
mmetsp:Transcript_15676/g.28156  ORF Transcript_15676/g.28156 Transcript_15676/m.28156 type:complete len:488 (+) Transcript_15676:4028-5491(+)